MARPNTPDKFHTLYKINPTTKCWEWQLTKHSSGHGVWRWNGKYQTAHRVSLMILGVELGDLQVNHHCDNAGCVNPEHLYLGTQQQNMQDRSQRSRTARGTQANKSKLTEQAIREIRNDTTSTLASLGRKYGVTYHSIRKIKQKESWSWL